jgi:hypothetical protein
MIYLIRVKSLQESQIAKQWAEKRLSKVYTRDSMIRSQSGQATLEYVLLLIITVSLLLSLTAQFFRPMGDFINDYMGSYVSCLLESGELPSMGASSQSASAESCDYSHDRFNIAEGRRPNGQGSSGSDPSKASTDKSRTKSENSGSSSGGGGYAGSNSQSSRGSNGYSSHRNGEVGATDPKVVEISIANTEEAGFNKRGSGHAYDSISGSGAAQPTITYNLSEEEQKKQEAIKKQPTRVIASDLPERSPKKMIITPPPVAKSATDLQMNDWGLGDYFRFILIAAIIIVIIALIGGQAARLSKSWEK